MFKCLKCGQSIGYTQVKDRLRCPYCGYRIVMKERPNVVRKVNTL